MTSANNDLFYLALLVISLRDGGASDLGGGLTVMHKSDKTPFQQQQQGMEDREGQTLPLLACYFCTEQPHCAAAVPGVSCTAAPGSR